MASALDGFVPRFASRSGKDCMGAVSGFQTGTRDASDHRQRRDDASVLSRSACRLQVNAHNFTDIGAARACVVIENATRGRTMPRRIALVSQHASPLAPTVPSKRAASTRGAYARPQGRDCAVVARQTR